MELGMATQNLSRQEYTRAIAITLKLSAAPTNFCFQTLCLEYSSPRQAPYRTISHTSLSSTLTTTLRTQLSLQNLTRSHCLTMTLANSVLLCIITGQPCSVWKWACSVLGNFKRYFALLPNFFFPAVLEQWKMRETRKG